VRYQETTRVYSVASAPSREDLEFCIRRVPGGELTSDLAVDREVGDSVGPRGPYGDFHLEEPSARDVVFLATGTGVAPFESMIDDSFETGRDGTGRDRYEGGQRDVWLFPGAGWVDTLPYHETFQAYADGRERFHYVPTVSREPFLSDRDGETEHVQYVLATYFDDGGLERQSLPGAFEQHREPAPRRPVGATLAPSQMEVYACGLTAMVEGLVTAVERVGVPPEHTQFEGVG
jgi:CDP-4-dehydro-6-deoxyglucose reductase